MRIPLFARVPLVPLTLFAGGLFVVQQVEGTSLSFSALSLLYILLFGVACNIAGGITRPAGGFIFSAGLFTVIIGITYKAILGEPGQSNLMSPNIDMLIYCASMAQYALLALLVKYIRPKKGLLAGSALGASGKKSAFGCLVFGVFLIFLSLSPSTRSTGIVTALRQLNIFLPMAILLGTYYESRISNGTRSTNWIVLTAGAIGFFTGLVGFSKEGMFAPPLTWVVACIAAGHNFTRKQIVGGLLAGAFMVSFLVPFSQIGRNFKDVDNSFVANTSTALDLVMDLPRLRTEFLQAEKTNAEEENLSRHYYNIGQGLFDRLTIFGPDDALITNTDDVSEEGFAPTLAVYSNIVPHFIWPNKPTLAVGNLYAHEIGGVVGDEDETTGISFSPSADAYHQARWLGVFTVLPVTIFLLFYITEALAGDLRKSPWGLLFVLGAAHSASEGMIGGQVYIFSIGALSVTFVALMARYVFPTVGGILLNQERTRVRKGLDFRKV